MGEYSIFSPNQKDSPLFLRPSSGVITEHGEYFGVVSEVEFLGSYYIVEISMRHGEKVWLSSNQQCHKGDEISFDLIPERMMRLSEKWG